MEGDTGSGSVWPAARRYETTSKRTLRTGFSVLGTFSDTTDSFGHLLGAHGLVRPPRNSCSDAFIVALNETCDGESWYTSTKELQLASLEFCMACRTFQTLHLKVDPQTPRRLFAAVDPLLPHSKRPCLTRVPGLRARWVTWNIPTAEKLRIPIFAISDADYLQFGDAFEGSLDAVAWPCKLQTIVFCHSSRFNQAIELVQWSESLEVLGLGGRFNQSIEDVSWPDSLQTLSVGYEFNQPIDLVQWPASLQRLEFRGRFNQRIDNVSWPDLLQTLEFGTNFNQPIEQASWPDSLQVLAFGNDFKQPIEGVVWPASLKKIIFSLESFFNHPLEHVVWPMCLEKLVFGTLFDHPIERVAFPASLQDLTFGDTFDQPIEDVSWPDSIQRLVFGDYFNKPIDNVRWPASLREITFGWVDDGYYGRMKDRDNGIVIFSEFNQRLDRSAWPASLRRLTLGEKFRQSLHGLGTWMPNLDEFRLLDFDSGGESLLRGIEWPKGLRQLTVFEDSNLDGVEIPSTVKVSYPYNGGCFRAGAVV